jgi:hypothetical protein
MMSTTIVSNEVFCHVTNLERPLGSTRRFLDALALLSETLKEPEAGAVNEIVQATLERVAEIDKEYSTLFRLTHPSREHFEREGWPTDRAE